MKESAGADLTCHIDRESAKTIFGQTDVTYGNLQRQVRQVLERASWWDKWGEDCTVLVSCLVVVLPLGLHLMSCENPVLFGIGVFILGFCHGMDIVKAAHSISHNAYGFRPSVNSFLAWFTTEFIGAFPTGVALDAHIKIHHPHTNVIGLGDSSSWKAPVLGRFTYMFLAPLALPILTPMVGTIELMKVGEWKRMLQYWLSFLAGYGCQFLLYHLLCGLPMGSALFWIFGTRAVFMPTYIHVNIFQHIGLSMYSSDNRPERCHQMTYGVLNLSRHPILDFNFGHSIINCHLEHHLFPKLSDNLCLKIKPVVQRFCTENGLPYFEKTYANRFSLFLRKYDTLMVDAPPITQFVAVQ